MLGNQSRNIYIYIYIYILNLLCINLYCIGERKIKCSITGVRAIII